MPINPTPQPVDVVINPNGESPKVKDFIINAPLIVQSTNVKNKLDTITETTEVLSTRISALESNSVINTSNSVVNTINNIINQSDPYFVSITPNSIETSGSLYLSGAIRTTYISSSTGARITGSVTQGHPSNISSGEYSHAEGEGTKAVNFGSHAEGYLTTANSNGSHAEGHLSYTFSLIGPDKLGYSAHAEGTETSACGNYSHSEGYRTHASGAQSHTEGDNTITYGAASHAEGLNTVAYGDYSHAGGHGTIASGSHQTVFGSYNKRLNTTSLFAIGNGTGDPDTLRNDIFRVESTGELVLSGGIRQNARFITSTFGGQTHNLTRSDYIFILYTAGNNNTVYLPKITNTTTDKGLTVIIRQHDATGNAANVTITSHPENSGYVIIGFDNTGTSIVTNPGGMSPTANRSVMLTFIGTIPANGAPGTWIVISNSLC